MGIINRGFNYLKTHGLKKAIHRFFEKVYFKLFRRVDTSFEREEQENYLKWIEQNEPNEVELEAQRRHKFTYSPKISIIVPLFNTPEIYFRELAESVLNQTYSNIELCLADGSTEELTYINDIVKSDSRIIYKKLEKNLGIAGNSNEALKLATGDYIALLDHDDIIPLFSIYEIVKCINENMDADFIFTDEDKIMESKDKRMGPHFKSDYAPDTFRSYNYICHFSVFRKDLMDKIKGFKSDYDGSQDYDIILRAIENANRIVHIPKILYHWRINENSVASSAAAKPYAYVAAKKAIKDSLTRQNIDADIIDSSILGLYRVIYKVKGQPLVSIIIPNKDQKKDLERCINSIEKSTYKNYEIIIVENNSVTEEIFKYYEKLKMKENVKVVECNLDSFNYSKLNNFGINNSNGKFILLLNNDIEIISQDFLQTLIGDAQREDIGAVGAKLLYKNNTIQHAGVVLNHTGVAGHVNLNVIKYEAGYMGRTMIQQNFSAVTGAMMMFKRSEYDKVGGLDEAFPVAYNDIDLCLKFRDIGKYNMYEPYVEAYHYESQSRGYEDTKEKKERLDNDGKRLIEKWKKYFDMPDPFFNVNFRNDVSRIRVRTDKVSD